MATDQEKNAISIKELIIEQNRLLTEQNELAKDRLGTDKQILSDQMDISNVIKDQTKSLGFQRAEKSAILRATYSISKISETIATLGKEDLTNSRSIANLGKSRLTIDKNIRLLQQTQTKLLSEQVGLTEGQYRSNVSLAESIDDQVKNAILLKVEMGQVNNITKSIAKASGVKLFGGVSEVLGKIPLLSGLAPMFSQAGKEAESVAAEMEKKKFGVDKFQQLVKEGLSIEDSLEKSGSSLDDIKAFKNGDFSQAAIDAATMNAAFKSMGGNIAKSLGPLALITGLVIAMVEVDKAASDMAKGMNMSYQDALSMRSELTDAAMESGNIFVSTKGMSESLTSISAALGTNVMLSTEMLTQFTEMRTMAGFTNEELQGIAAISLTTNKSMDEVTGEFMAQAKISAQQQGVLLNEKELLKSIGKVSAATTLSLGKNPGLIGEAVATTKALGMEMSKVDSIANSLLDFESSIESELSAELLINKDLNLEKARQFALNNDLAGVAREISEQAGSAAEFGAMNRIQQEALAKAVGMGREDLAQTLFVQEQLAGATGEQAIEQEAILNRRIEEVGLAQAQQELAEKKIDGLKNQASMQDKLNKSVEKLKEVFISLAVPIMQLISPIIDLLIPAISSIAYLLTPVFELFNGISGILTGNIESLSTMATILGTMAIAVGVFYTTMKGIKEVQTAVNILKATENGLSLKSIGLALRQKIADYSTAAINVVQGAWKSYGAVPIVGGVLAAAATIAGIAYLANVAKPAADINSPADGKTQISTKEGGLFELSKNDDIVAFPGASKVMNSGYGGGTAVVQQDNSETNNLLKQLISTNQQGNGLLSKKQELSPVGLYEIQ